jgi:hypothetical protein
MEAHADLGKAQIVQGLLQAIDAAQAVFGDAGAIGKARGQTGKLRLVPDGKTQGSRHGPHLGLVQSGFDERLARSAL